MNRTGVVSVAGLFTAAILYVAVNALFNVSAPSLRLDVTEDRLYTLSKGTLATLERIDEPVELHFFFSDRLGREVPFYASYGRRVRELLTELSGVSDGKVILYQYEPEPFSEGEDSAVSFGVQGIPLDQGGELAYFGLAGTNTVDDIELIPFFQPERETLLEYDLTQMIYALSNPEPTVVGVMGSLPLMGDMQAQMQGGVLVPWAIANELRKHYELINLPETVDVLPDSVNVMMVVHPQKMTKRAIYELEQFLFRGGRALVFIDPKAESDLSVGPNRTSTSANSLNILLKHWGIDVPDGKLVGDRSMALRINAGSAAQPVPAEYLVWLGVPPDYMTQSDPITSQLSGLNIATAGHITSTSDSTLAIEPLISSSENSALIDVDDVLGLRPDILGLLDRFIPDANEYVIAARLNGKVSTAFPNGPPARTIPNDEPDAPQLKSSNGPINLVLVADSDLLEERFWLRKQQFFGREVDEKIAGNADFVVNALGNLTGSDDLLQLRSRGVSQRPFEKIKALEQEAEQRLQHKERELQNKLKETQAKIAELEGVREMSDGTTAGTKLEINLSNAQRNEIESMRREMLSLRKQLRGVQRSLREDVRSLESWLKFINIGLVPMLVSVAALGVLFVRVMRRRRAYFNNRERGMA